MAMNFAVIDMAAVQKRVEYEARVIGLRVDYAHAQIEAVLMRLWAEGIDYPEMAEAIQRLQRELHL